MTSSHPLGEVLHDGGTIGLQYERHLTHSVERVWRALTESDQLRHWLPVDIVGERVVGGDLHATFWPDVVEKYEIAEPTLPARILTWDPPHAFSWMWDRDTLIFELHPIKSGTRLIFTTWIVDTNAGANNTGAGYHVCLDQLVELIEIGSTPPFIDADPSELEGRYAALFE